MSNFDGAVAIVGGATGLPGGGATTSEVDAAIASAIAGLSVPATLNDLSDVSGTPTTGQVLEYNGSGWVPYTIPDKTVTIDPQVILDGGGALIPTGIRGDMLVTSNATITQVTLLPDQTGSMVVQVWADSYANFPPTSGDLLLTMTLSAAPKLRASASIAVPADTILRFNVVSVTSVTRATAVLTMTRTV